MTRRTRILAACLAAAVAGVPIGATSQEVCTPSANVSTFKEGLNNPRGLKFGPDGSLYVAEGGTADGNLSTVDICPQLQVPEVGPYRGGFTSSIARIAPDGTLTRIVTGLPSSRTTRPSADGLSPKRRCQSAWLSRIAPPGPSRSSAGPGRRPISGPTPRIGSRSGVTAAPLNRSGRPSARKFTSAPCQAPIASNDVLIAFQSR